MKKKLLIITSMLLNIAAGAQTIDIHKTDGTTVSYPASDVSYIGFTSCSSDDDDDENASALVGTWRSEYRIVYDNYHETYVRYDYDEAYNDYGDAFIFKSDGTGFQEDHIERGRTDRWPITWKYNASTKQLTVTDVEDSNVMYWDVYEVTSLTADKMELRWIGDEDGSASSQGMLEFTIGLVKK